MAKKKNVKNENNEYYQILDNEKNYNIIKILIVILLLGTCFFILYKTIIISNLSIFKSGINHNYKTIETILDKINFLSNPININGVLEIDSSAEELKNIDNYKFNLDFVIDNNIDKYNAILDINNNNQLIANINYLNKDGNSYIYLNNLYDNTIKLDTTYKNIKVKELKRLNKALKDSISNQIINDYLTNSKEEININNIKYEYNYVEASLSKEKLSKIVGNIITNIKEDHKLMAYLTDSFNISLEELDNYLDNLLKNIIVKSFTEVKIRYYYEGYFAKIVGFKVLIDDNTLIEEYNDYFNINNIITLNKDNNNYYLNSNNFKVIITKFKEDLIDLEYEYYDNKGILHYNYDNNHGNIKFSYVNNKAYSFNYDFIVSNNFETANILDYKIVNKKAIEEEDYLDIYNYIDKNIDNNFLKKILTNLVQELLKY